MRENVNLVEVEEQEIEMGVKSVLEVSELVRDISVKQKRVPGRAV